MGGDRLCRLRQIHETKLRQCFFNEIPNDNLTDTALKRYFEISNLKGWIESDNGYPNAYMVTLYNFNNYEVMFENEKGNNV